MWVGSQNNNSYLGELPCHQPLLTAFHHVQCISQISLKRNKKIQIHGPFLLHLQLPVKQHLSFKRESSLHLTFIRIPYAVQKGITCLPSFPFNFGIAAIAMKSKTSGARSLISVSMLFQWNSTRFLCVRRDTQNWWVRTFSGTKHGTLGIYFLEEDISYGVSQRRYFHGCLSNLMWIGPLNCTQDIPGLFWGQNLSPRRKL